MIDLISKKRKPMVELPSVGVAECLLGGAEEEVAVRAEPLLFLSLLSRSRAPPIEELNREFAGEVSIVAKRPLLPPPTIASSELRSLADERSARVSYIKSIN